MKRAALVVSFGVSLGGCTPSQSALLGPVRSEVERRIGVPLVDVDSRDPRVPAAVADLLRRPLDRDAAVRIAIANNRRLHAAYEDLGVAGAAIADATVLAPLDIEASYEFAVDGGSNEVEIDAIQDVLGLLQMPQRRGIAGARLRAARARAIAATVQLVAHVESAFYGVVAAQQELELRQTEFDAASAGAELIERMHSAGNATDLDRARELAFREEARIDLVRAQAAVQIQREQLNGLLGVSGEDTAWSASARLSELPAQLPAMDEIEKEAITASLELTALRSEAEAAEGSISYARFRTFLPELGVGASVNRDEEGEWAVGPAVRVGIPLFNWQQGPRRRAHAELRKARNALTATAVETRAAARATRERVLAAHAEARQLIDVVLPLRQRVLDETLLQYNAMNASTFELLSARREQVEAARRYVDALRRYWVAMSEIDALRRGGPMTTSAATEPANAGGTAPASERH